MKHTGPISGIAAHRNDLVATAGYDNQVLLWDGRTHEPLHRVHHDHLANQCSFNAHGNRLVTSSSDYTARLWHVPSMRLQSVFAGHEDDVEMAAFNPHSTQIATCSRDHTARLFSLTGEPGPVCRGHTADVISVGWERCGNVIVTSSDDGTIRRWDTTRGECLEIIDLGGVETDTLVIVHDNLILAGNDKGHIISVGANGNHSAMAAHSAGIKRLAYDSDKRILTSLSYDHTLSVWTVGIDGMLQRIDRTEFPAVVWPRSCAFLGESRIVFSTFGSTYAIYDYKTREWDVDGITPDESINALTIHQNAVYSIGDAGDAFRNGERVGRFGSVCNFLTPWSDQLLSGGQLGHIYEVLSNTVLHSHRSPVNCAATFTKDGQEWAIVGAYTGEGLLFRRKSQRGAIEYVASIHLHTNAVKGIATSSDTIFSVCATGAAAFHRISDFQLATHVEKAHDRIANCCTSLGTLGFASAGRDLTLRIWRDGRRTVIATPHVNSIKCVCATPDGRVIATGSYTGSIALYDLQTARWLRQVRPTPTGISALCYDTCSARFLASSYDGQIHAIATN